MDQAKEVTKTRDKVRKYLKSSFGDSFKEANGDFIGVHGSTAVMVVIRPWAAGNDVQVRVVAGIASGVDTKPDLMKYLLKENHDFVLGAFALEGDDSVVFMHTILGSNLDKSELDASVKAVATTGDQYDDIITGRWGGVKVRDMVSGMSI
jgi:hypothetical protein